MIPRRYLRAFDDFTIGCALVAIVFRAFKWYPYDDHLEEDDDWKLEESA